MSVEKLITDNIDVWTSAIKTKSASGRGSSNKLELYGLKKLRELILELAVSGKLVPQDANDEPTSKLLERIAAERERKVREEGLKTKAEFKIDRQDLYINCPKTWSMCRLGNLAKFIDYRGKTPKKIESGVRLITAKNVRFGYLSLSPAEFISETEYESWMTRGFPQVGDLLFTPEAPLGNVAIIDLNEKFALAQRAICFQFHERSLSPFLKIAIMSPAFQQELIKHSSGMTATGIKASKLKEIVVPIPPLEEQKRIVAKVDELMALCGKLESQTEANIEAHNLLVKTLLETLTNAKDADELNDSWQRISEHFDVLFTTEDSINQLKQIILQLAVMGKLVKQDPNEEPASKLLERIAAEKEQLIKDKKVKKQKPLPPISDDDKPFDVPNGWTHCRLGNVIHVSSGKNLTSSKMVKDGGIPVFGGNGITGYHDEANIVEKSLIIGRVGYYCGSIHITPKKAWVTDNAFITYFSKHNIDMDFLALLLKATDLKENENATAQPVISGSKVYPIVVALPPTHEQKRIVAKVDELMALCDALKSKLHALQEIQLNVSDTLVKQAS